jgi:integrase
VLGNHHFCKTSDYTSSGVSRWGGRCFQTRPVVHFDFESQAPTFAGNMRRIGERSNFPLPGDSEMKIYLARDTPSSPNTDALHEAVRGDLRRKMELLWGCLSHKPTAVVIIDPFDLSFVVDRNREVEVIEICLELGLLLSRYPRAAIIATFNLKKKDRRVGWPNLLVAPGDFLEETSGVNEILARTDVRIGFDRHPRDPELLVLNGIRRDESFHPLLLRQVGVEPNLCGFELAPPGALDLADAMSKQPCQYWHALPNTFSFEGIADRKVPRSSLQRIIDRARSLGLLQKEGLAKGDVGIREKKPVPTLAEFAERHFLPFVRTTFKEKTKTHLYYKNGVKNLLAFERLAGKPLDAITTEEISAYSAKRQKEGLQIASINRELQVLRRMFALAQEWGKTEKALPRVKMLPGERHRDRVLTPDEEDRYFKAMMSDAMKQHPDPYLLRDVASILLDCGLRPEECFRLRLENVLDGMLEIPYGKTPNARRRIPLTDRVKAILDMRLSQAAGSEWVFPAPTKSGHIEPSSIKKQRAKAFQESKAEPFELYTLRHTCLTRWAPHMDPWTLAYLAGHRDMSTTKRYVHPQEHTIRQAMARAQGGHKTGHNQDNASQPIAEHMELIQ